MLVFQTLLLKLIPLYCIIGLGLSQATRQAWDTKFVSLSFLAKFLIWPGIVFIVLMIDTLYLHFYSSAIHQVLTILAFVPLAANTVVVASQLKAQPEKATIAVLISTIFALFLIPVVATFYAN